jgi:hypothetical protein
MVDAGAESQLMAVGLPTATRRRQLDPVTRLAEGHARPDRIPISAASALSLISHRS